MGNPLRKRRAAGARHRDGSGQKANEPAADPTDAWSAAGEQACKQNAPSGTEPNGAEKLGI